MGNSKITKMNPDYVQWRALETAVLKLQFNLAGNCYSQRGFLTSLRMKPGWNVKKSKHLCRGQINELTLKTDLKPIRKDEVILKEVSW